MNEQFLLIAGTPKAMATDTFTFASAKTAMSLAVNTTLSDAVATYIFCELEFTDGNGKLWHITAREVVPSIQPDDEYEDVEDDGCVLTSEDYNIPQNDETVEDSETLTNKEWDALG